MLSIIFPAYNESESLKRFPTEVFPVFEKLGRAYEIVIIDDGSKDNTAEVAAALGGKTRLVKHPHNMGLGAALRTGFKEAKGELVLTMDTDLTFAPSLAALLLDRLAVGDCDVVSGSPKLAGFGSDIPSYRVAISKLATLTYSIILGRKITAVSPILRLYRRVDLLDLPLNATGFDINAEILFELIQRGKRVVEIAAPLTQRIHGESKLNYRHEIKRHLRLVGRMAKWRIGLHGP
ncbi:MAG: glycosyltransferase family 2 protein [Polyangiales bacterium]